MSISRINTFHAKEEKENGLKQFLMTLIPYIKASPGCVSCEVLQSENDPRRLIVLEVWESKESHQASVQNIPVKDLQSVITLLESPPMGEYFHTS